jgi:polyphosphate kinase
MGFCTPKQHKKFLELCPASEKYMVDAGMIVIKYWMEVGQKEQQRRFQARIKDPLRQWKLSPMDLESFRRWYEYSRARDSMLEATDIKHAPWYVIRSDDKKRARLNCIAHLLSLIPYGKVPHEKVELPKRKTKNSYDDQAPLKAAILFRKNTDALLRRMLRDSHSRLPLLPVDVNMDRPDYGFEDL